MNQKQKEETIMRHVHCFRCHDESCEGATVSVMPDLAQAKKDLIDRLVLYSGQRMQQHYENLRLWNNGTLIPTTEDEQEVEVVKEGLKGAIHELEELEKFLKGDK